MTDKRLNPTDGDAYLLNHGQQKAKREDSKQRTAEKHYATRSPLVRPMETALEDLLYNVIREWYTVRATNGQIRRTAQGAWLSLYRLIEQFLLLEPGEHERPQPELGLRLISHTVYSVLLDRLWVEGRGSYSIYHLKNQLATPLFLEWWRRTVQFDANAQAMEMAFAVCGHKRGSTLKQRQTNIVRVANQFNIPKPNDELIAQSMIPLISLLADPGLWGGDPFLVADDKKVSFSPSVKQALTGVTKKLGWSLATCLPITYPPIDWRHTGAPDCGNSTGGYKTRELRLVRSLGHGKHRGYRSVSSQQALDALNRAQQTKYTLDLQMADFVEALDQLSDYDLGGESFDGLPRRPLYTKDDLERGSRGAASLPEVLYRKLAP